MSRECSSPDPCRNLAARLARIIGLAAAGAAVASYEPFATGWLRGGSAWGRPVDLLVLPDGSLLVSDDFGDAVYRIRYEG